MARKDERVIERFVDRNLGTSPLAGRELQVRNLPTAGEAVATSQATLRNLQRERGIQGAIKLSQLLKQRADKEGKLQAQNRSSARRQRSASTPTGTPQLILRQTPGDTPTGRAAGFEIRGKGQRMTFKNIDEIKSFLRANPEIAAQLGAGVPKLANTKTNLSNLPGFLDPKIARELGLQAVDTSTGRQILGFSPRQSSGIISSFLKPSAVSKSAGQEIARKNAEQKAREENRILRRTIRERRSRGESSPELISMLRLIGADPITGQR